MTAMASPFKYVLPDRSEPDAPFVVCLGWVNCRMRTLQKYGQVMTDMGCPVMLAIAPTLLAFHPLDRAREGFAAKLLDSLLETGACKQRRLVIYCFSNGGAAIEQALVRLMASEQRFKPLQEAFGGVVFDSSPCYMHTMVGARAVAEGQPWLAAAVAQTAFILGALLLVLFKPLIGFWPSRFWNYAVYHSTHRPELYLYSRDDHLCDVKELEPLLAIRESRGGDITRKVWAQSRHVGHLKEHPKEYVSAIQQFFKSKLGFAAPSTAVDKATSSAQKAP